LPKKVIPPYASFCSLKIRVGAFFFYVFVFCCSADYWLRFSGNFALTQKKKNGFSLSSADKFGTPLFPLVGDDLFWAFL